MLRECTIVARILVGGAAVYKNKMTIYNKTIQICPLCISYERLGVELVIMKDLNCGVGLLTLCHLPWHYHTGINIA